MAMDTIPGRELLFPNNPRVLICAPSQSGKSTFLKNCLLQKESLFPKSYDRVIYSSPHFDPKRMLAKDRDFMNQIQTAAAPVPVDCVSHILTVSELAAYDGQAVLLILDDHPTLFESQDVSDIFIMLSSHRDFDIFVVTHSALHNRGRYFNLIWSNCTTFVFFQHKTDKLSFGRYSSRLFPYCQNYLHRCMQKITELYGPYAHLMVTCDPAATSNYSVRSNIFKETNIPYMYVFKDP